jgi:hypothetical protein
MWKFFALVIVLLILFVYFGPGFALKSEHIDRTYASTRPKPTLVLFYMNGCKACSDFMPTWKTINNLQTVREKIFAEEHEASSLPPWAVGVSVFPTIRLYKSDPSVYPYDYVQYNGNRTVADINAFVNQFLQYS